MKLAQVPAEINGSDHQVRYPGIVSFLAAGEEPVKQRKSGVNGQLAFQKSIGRRGPDHPEGIVGPENFQGSHVGAADNIGDETAAQIHLDSLGKAA